MKRIIRIILALIVVMGVITVTASARETMPTIGIDSVETKAGEEIKMPVYIRNNTGIMCAKITVEYTTGLKVLKVEKGEIFSAGTFIENTSLNKNGTFDVVWSNTKDVNKDGELFIITFKVPDNAKEKYQIELSYDQENTFNSRFQEITLSCGSGVIMTEQETQPEKEPGFFQKIIGFFKMIWNWIINIFK